MLGDHWCWGKGGWFEASNFVPLVIRVPGRDRPRGIRVDAFTESVDLMPTILDWLGLDHPADLNGSSLMPWLSGTTPESWRNGVFWEFDFRSPHTQAVESALGLTSDQATLNVVRDDAYKYVHFSGLPPLLYDLEADPGELENIAGRQGSGEIIARYAQRLLNHRMLHNERRFANAMLTTTGVTYHRGPRGLPMGWSTRPEPARPIAG